MFTIHLHIKSLNKCDRYMQLSKEERDLSWSTRQGALGCLRELSEISQGVRYLKLTRTNITESTVVLEYSHQGDFSDFGTFNCLCIQIYKLLKQPGQVILLKWTCLDHVPLWRMAFPKPVASNHLARCSLEQSLHVYDYFCY